MRRKNPLSVRVRAPSRGVVVRLPSEAANMLPPQGPLAISQSAASVASNVRYEEGVVRNAAGHERTDVRSPFLDSLVAHWRLDEASGTRKDATLAARDLTSVAGTSDLVGQIAAGKINAGAQFPGAMFTTPPVTTVSQSNPSVPHGTVGLFYDLIASSVGDDRLLVLGWDASFTTAYRTMLKLSDGSLVNETAEDFLSGLPGAYAPTASCFMFNSVPLSPLNNLRFEVVNLANTVIGTVDLSGTEANTTGFGLAQTVVYENTTDSFYVLGLNASEKLECVKINPTTLAFTEIMNSAAFPVSHGLTLGGFYIASPDFIWFDAGFAVGGVRLSDNQLCTLLNASNGFAGTGCYAPNTGKLYIPAYNESTGDPEVWEVTPGLTPTVSHVFTGVTAAGWLVYDEIQGRIIGQPCVSSENGFVIDPIGQTVVDTPAFPVGTSGFGLAAMSFGKLYIAGGSPGDSLQLWE